MWKARAQLVSVKTGAATCCEEDAGDAQRDRSRFRSLGLRGDFRGRTVSS
jgi:hypothetical protein